MEGGSLKSRQHGAPGGRTVFPLEGGQTVIAPVEFNHTTALKVIPQGPGLRENGIFLLVTLNN